MGAKRICQGLYRTTVHFVLVSILVWFVLPFHQSVQAEGSNMLLNGSFETQLANGNPTDWTIKEYTAGPVVTVDGAVYHEGTHAVKMDATAGGRKSVAQNVPSVVAGQSYKVSAWIRTENVASLEGARIRIGFYDQASALIGSLVYTSGLKGSNSWSLVSKTLQAPIGSVKLAIELMPDTGTGITWYDDVQVVPFYPVQGVALDLPSAQLTIGQSAALHASLTPSNATNQQITWASSNSNVATVNSGGTVTAIGYGTAMITATTSEGGFSAKCYVSVGDSGVSVDHIAVNSDKVTAAVTDTIELSAVVFPQNAYDQRVVWTSSNPAVATVVDGRIHVVGQGTATITVTSIDGNKTASTMIEANSLLRNGNFEMVSSGSLLPDGWTVTNYEAGPAASLDNAMAKDGGKSIKIDASNSGRISLSKEITSIIAGNYYKFAGWIKTANVQSVEGARVRIGFYDSANAVITPMVFVGGFKGSRDWQHVESIIQAPPGAVKMRIENMPDQGTGITWYDNESVIPWTYVQQLSLTPDKLVLQVAESSVLQASIAPVNATNQNLTWTTSDASVASVSNGVVAAISQGIAAVTATTQDRGFRAVSLVQVGGNTDITVPDYTATTTFGASVNGQVVAADSNSHALTYTKLAESEHGTVHVKSDGTWTYKANPGSYTSDHFYIGVTDHNGSSTYATVNISIQPLATVMEPYTNVHPSLFLDQAKVNQLKTAILPGGTHEHIWNEIKAKADAFVLTPPTTYYVDKYTGEAWQRDTADRTIYLALAYLIDGDVKYYNAAKAYALASVSYPTWGRAELKNIDLAAGHQLLSLSIVYDWLYNDLDTVTRETIKQKLETRGSEMYLKATGQPFEGSMDYKKVYWTEGYLQNHLWVSLSGLTAAGVALHNTGSSTLPWLEYSIGKFDQVLQALADDGASQEGYPYWQYGLEYLLKYGEIAQKFFDVDIYTDNKWLEQASTYAAYMSLPKNSWKPNVNHLNFGDDANVNWYGPDMSLRLLAGKYSDGIAQGLANEIDTANIESMNVKYANLLWYDPTVPEASVSSLPTLHIFDNLGIVSARSDWSGDGSVVAFKSGPAIGHKALHMNESPLDDWGVAHAHPDANHFMIFGDGEWLIRDDGYANKKTSNHNTLLINGTGQLGEGAQFLSNIPLQSVKSEPAIVKTVSTSVYDYMLGDATQAYDSDLGLQKYKRHLIYMKPDILVVVDDIEVDQPKQLELRFFPESQNIQSLGDGSYLTTGLTANLRYKELTGSNVTSSAAPVPYVTDESSMDRQAFRLLNTTQSHWTNAAAFSWSDSQSIPKNVTLTQQGNIWTFASEEAAVSLNLSTDTVQEVQSSGGGQTGNDATLIAIVLNGKFIQGFNSGTFTYTVPKSSKKPQATVSAIKYDKNATVHTDWNGDATGTATIQVTSANGTVTNTYTLTVVDSSLLTVTGAESNVVSAGFIPDNGIDDNMTTIWSAKADSSLVTPDNPQGDPWIQFHFDDVKSVNQVDIAWYLGHQRQASFDIEVSQNGTVWTNVYSGTSSGTTAEYESYTFPSITAKYIRIIGHGTNQGVYTSIKDVNVYEGAMN
ncbi:Ig-like domain-containing protein [Paenibacillus sp. HWE-109]|uniref:Ig-like domain-containing protein n=1 Tax=Paenibacillus sp. HWE-109 TaxID=1306526 RepID=UPI001EE0600B|nr:Ig-like domain-containing protein [Paenibacillus sp. HWE-109]UKS28326.1 Ig-like domain-containing protein [Paenibacillus sp. HWE-109]